jgi:pyruvate dehydrogenase E2 component (dihydrolipoamide acetyltransferase)
MTFEFKLPDIGEGVVEGEVVRWLVKEGDRLREDQPMVEIMTDKATVEIPAPKAGRVSKRHFSEGQICPVGKTLVTIELEGSSAGASAVVGSATADVANTPASSATTAAPHPIAHGSRAVLGNSNGVATYATVLATPATRKLARELGVDIRTVVGSGRAGRITSDDVRAHSGLGAGEVTAVSRGPQAQRASSSAAGSYAPQAAAVQPGDERIPFRGVRKRIAEALVRSKHTAAHFSYVEEVDVTDLVTLRTRANARLAERGLKLSYLPFIIKATVAALKKYPALNSTLDEATSEIVRRRAYHIGLATTTDAGLLVPVIRDADQKSLLDLAQDIERLSQAARSGKATREELSGSTFTITSLGTLGGLHAAPIINFPEAAILGVHKIARRPMVEGPSDKIVVRDMMNLSISVDHRLVDGHEAARFVAEVKANLETTGLLFLESV